jgi:Fe-S cluster assembly protein SufD
MNAAVRPEPLSPYRAAYEGARPRPGVTESVRAAAFGRFVELGFPGAREEAWKYTSLRRLESRSFALPGPADVTAPLPPALADHVVVLENGALRDTASTLGTLPHGVRVRTLEQVEADGEPLAPLLRVPPGGGTERFVALNAALCPNVVVIDVATGARPEAALHLAVTVTGTTATMSHPRVVIRAASGSEARIVLHHSGDDAVERFTNSYVDVEVAADAVLHLYRLQAPGAKAFLIERIDATVGQRGRYVMHDAQLGGSLGRLDLNARLVAPGAAAELTGLFLADGARHLDTHARVDHIAPDTQSLLDYRGIAAGRGRAVFNGKAVVHEGAQKSHARQSSRNLLLSAGAEIDTKPELEIYADDVQCSHGATTGQLDPAALFYLRSRGLDEQQARSALTRAFAGAVLSRMDLPPFAAAVHAAFDDRLSRLLEMPA